MAVGERLIISKVRDPGRARTVDALQPVGRGGSDDEELAIVDPDLAQIICQEHCLKAVIIGRFLPIINFAPRNPVLRDIVDEAVGAEREDSDAGIGQRRPDAAGIFQHRVRHFREGHYPSFVRKIVEPLVGVGRRRRVLLRQSGHGRGHLFRRWGLSRHLALLCGLGVGGDRQQGEGRDGKGKSSCAEIRVYHWLPCTKLPMPLMSINLSVPVGR